MNAREMVSALTARGWSLAGIAHWCDVSERTVYDWRRGAEPDESRRYKLDRLLVLVKAGYVPALMLPNELRIPDTIPGKPHGFPKP